MFKHEGSVDRVRRYRQRLRRRIGFDGVRSEFLAPAYAAQERPNRPPARQSKARKEQRAQPSGGFTQRAPLGYAMYKSISSKMGMQVPLFNGSCQWWFVPHFVKRAVSDVSRSCALNCNNYAKRTRSACEKRANTAAARPGLGREAAPAREAPRSSRPAGPNRRQTNWVTDKSNRANRNRRRRGEREA